MRRESHAEPHDDLRVRVIDLFRRDAFSAPLGIEVIEVEPRRALLAMAAREACLNAHGTGHGGALWTLADMAFGAAAFHRGHILTVGSDLSFFRPAPAEATIWAEAREVTRKDRTATFHIVLSLDAKDPATVVASGSFTGRWPAHG